jgi:UDP-N-acetylglucosamine--N-acetylmuramyl-(pentapeptide) pyrophosphoryl-undecaprenol N-acetylglucosamine transferase
MISPGANTPFVAIACGGTGGHLFPGLAVAEQLQKRGCAVGLLISPKDVDQEAVKSAHGMEIFTLPAVGLQNRNYFSFAGSFVKSLFATKKIFRQRRPAAVLAMGGFTSAPPIWVGKDFGAKTFLHESNTIPGRANRLLARFVDEAFVGFPSAAARLRARKVTATGTPVRLQFQPCDAAVCRAKLFGVPPSGGSGQPPEGGTPNLRPVILVMGGSQGASGINDLVLSALPLLGDRTTAWQWLHLTGPNDVEKVKQAYDASGFKAVVRPFLAEMDLALGAATAAGRAPRRSRKSPPCACRRCWFPIPPPRTIINFTTPRLLRRPVRRGCSSKKTRPRRKLPPCCVNWLRTRPPGRKFKPRWHNGMRQRRRSRSRTSF